MCLDRNDLYERAGWDGAAGTSRRQLLEKLQSQSIPFKPAFAKLMLVRLHTTLHDGAVETTCDPTRPSQTASTAIMYLP